MKEEKLSLTQFLEKYGQVQVVFDSYYEYSFTYKGEFNGQTIYVRVGGNRDRIYSFYVSAGAQSIMQLSMIIDMSYAKIEENNTIINEYYF